MSSKILKNCKKALLHLLKSINVAVLPFDIDTLFEEGVEKITVWYHKDYPYVYQKCMSRATVTFNDGTQIVICQYMKDFEASLLELEVHYQGTTIKLPEDVLNADKVHSYNRALKQAHTERDFWHEIEL